MKEPPAPEPTRLTKVEVLRGHRLLTELPSRHEIYEEIFDGTFERTAERTSTQD